jgi:hypothetical protein
MLIDPLLSLPGAERGVREWRKERISPLSRATRKTPIIADSAAHSLMPALDEASYT